MARSDLCRLLGVWVEVLTARAGQTQKPSSNRRSEESPQAGQALVWGHQSWSEPSEQGHEGKADVTGPPAPRSQEREEAFLPEQHFQISSS